VAEAVVEEVEVAVENITRINTVAVVGVEAAEAEVAEVVINNRVVEVVLHHHNNGKGGTMEAPTKISSLSYIPLITQVIPPIMISNHPRGDGPSHPPPPQQETLACT